MVKTMKRSGTVELSAEYSGSMTLLIPKDVAEPDWDAVKDGTFTYRPKEGGGNQIVLRGFAVIDHSEKYTLDGEAVRDITFGCTGKGAR
jgi:hypothetical protein